MRKFRKLCKRVKSDSEEPKTARFEDAWDLGEEDEEPDPRRAVNLRSLFIACKKVPQENEFGMESETNGTNTYFDEIAQKLNAWERRTGKKIRDDHFVCALSRKFGENFYPGDMVGKEALKIYRKEIKDAYHQMETPNKGANCKLLREEVRERKLIR